MNNKGQSLVLFVLIIPILLLVIIGVYDIGKMSLLKSELDDINNIAIDYGLDNMDSTSIENDIRALIIKNKSDIDNVEIVIEDDKIYIKLEDTINVKLFSKLFNVKSSYVGYIDDDKKVIERNR